MNNYTSYYLALLNTNISRFEHPLLVTKIEAHISLYLEVAPAIGTLTARFTVLYRVSAL